MRDESKQIINAIRGISVALGSHHANRVNASESDRLDQPNDSERAKNSGALFRFEYADTPIA